jgi:glycosyltransferase involved in cell wall biosynthesis
MSPARRRVCLISECLKPPFDEGYKNVGIQLARALSGMDTELLCLGGADVEAGGVKIQQAPFDKLFFSRNLLSEIEEFEPDSILYLSYSSDTAGSCLRGWRLSRQFRAKVGMVCVQPKQHGAWTRFFLPTLLSDVKMFVATHDRQTYYQSLGVNSHFVPLGGVDLERFKPLRHLTERQALRSKYGIPQDRMVLLHVGHILPQRSLIDLLALASRSVHVVIVGSSSTERDPALESALAQGGAQVLSGYLPDIHELYQLSDAYVFPVTESQGAITMPLSVLEALACNLPVLTTRFGVLPELFNAEDGVFFYETIDEAGRLLESLPVAGMLLANHMRRAVAPYQWSQVAQRILDALWAG